MSGKRMGFLFGGCGIGGHWWDGDGEDEGRERIRGIGVQGR